MLSDSNEQPLEGRKQKADSTVELDQKTRYHTEQLDQYGCSQGDQGQIKQSRIIIQNQWQLWNDLLLFP